MLDLLIENFKMSKIDDEGIREEVNTFIFGVTFNEITSTYIQI